MIFNRLYSPFFRHPGNLRQSILEQQIKHRPRPTTTSVQDLHQLREAILHQSCNQWGKFQRRKSYLETELLKIFPQ